MKKRASKNKNRKKSKSKAFVFLDTGDLALRVDHDRLPLSVGRGLDSDILLSNSAASRNHCTLEVRDNVLYVRDVGTKNGTIVGDRRINNDSLPITRSTCLVFGTTLLWLHPDEESLTTAHVTESVEGEAHGVCIVDICDSTEFAPAAVHEAGERMRGRLIGDRADAVLLMKNMGDGYLAIFKSPVLALEAAERVYDWQAGDRNKHRFDVRITLEAGPTFAAPASARSGLVINRTARLEKTQAADIVEPGKRIRVLKPKNRILLSSSLRQELDAAGKRRCVYLGRRPFKGFGNLMFAVYQFTPRNSSR